MSLVVGAVALAALVALGPAFAFAGALAVVAARAGSGGTAGGALVLRAPVGALLRRVLVLRARLLRVARLIAIACLLRALVALANLRIGLHARRDRGVACFWIHAHALRVRNAAERDHHAAGKDIRNHLA